MAKKPSPCESSVRLLSSLAILENLPTIQRRIEFAVEVLSAFLTENRCFACISGIPVGTTINDVCKGCSHHKNIAEYSTFECPIANTKGLTSCDISTSDSFFGYFHFESRHHHGSQFADALILNFVSLLATSFSNLVRKGQIEKNEEKYRQLFENMMNGFALHEIVLNREGKPIDYVFLDVNLAFEQLTGLRRTNIIGRKVTEVIPHIELDPADWIGRYGQVALTGQEIRFEQYAQPLGKWYSVLAFSPKRGQFAVIFEDITERQRTQEALRESEENLSITLNSIGDAVIAADTEGRITRMNTVAEKLTGWPASEGQGRPLEEVFNIINSKTRKKVTNPMTRALRDRTITGLANHTVVIGRDGDERQIAHSAAPIKDSEGEMRGVVVVFRDVSEEYKLQQALVKERHDLGERVKELQCLYATGEVVRSYRSIEEAFNGVVQLLPAGWHYPEITRARIRFDGADYVSDSFQETEWKQSSPLVVNGRQRGMVEVYHLKECPTLAEGPFLIQERDLIDEIAKILSEAIVREEMEQLRQFEKIQAIGGLAGGVAHDFNNQLTGILTLAEIIATQAENKDIRDSANSIVQAAQRLANLTGQLLAFARKGKYQKKLMDIHQIIGEVVPILSRSIDKRIVIRQTLEARPSTIVGDQAQLQSALLNVALNALDAMPQGGDLTFATDVSSLDESDVHVQTGRIPAGLYVEIRVTDTGIGMDKETQRRIFEPFFTTKEQGQGIGMGLAAVYGTIQNHHGVVVVESEVGSGSTLTIYLPLTEAVAEEGDEKGGSGPTRILLVDNNEMVRASGVMLLRAQGYDVVACQDGEEAVEYYRKSWKGIDLVMLDMVMPKMGGLDTFIALREINSAVRVILITGYSLTDEASEILNAGVRGFIQKPYTRKALMQKIAEVLV